PLDPSYHRGDPTAAGAAEHPDVDDVSLRSDAYELAAGAAAISGDDPRDMCSMPARIAREALIREVDRGEDTVLRLDEIRIRRDAGIEDRDRHTSPGYPLLPDPMGFHHARVDFRELIRRGCHRRLGAAPRSHRRVVMDERHRGHEAHRADAGGVREPWGCVDEGQRS